MLNLILTLFHYLAITRYHSLLYSQFTYALLTLTTFAVTQGFEISADSPLKQRRLEDEAEYDEEAAEEAINTAVAGYSVKFQGCHWTNTWNSDYDGDADSAPVITERYVRYRLCPADTCNSYKAGGCSNNYGDYFMDMNTYVAQEWQYHENMKASYCESVEAACEDAQEYDENYVCDYPDYCAENEDGDDEIDIADYLACAQLDLNNDDETAYYLGPACSDQGGSITMRVFTDEDCSTLSSTSFYALMGYDLDYYKNSITSYKCMSCKEAVAEDAEDGDEEDADEVIEMCETLYQSSGKCEQSGVLSGDQTFCSYIDTIKILRSDGSYDLNVLNEGSKVAGAFVGIFVSISALLSAYVYYLKEHWSQKKINLNQQ